MVELERRQVFARTWQVVGRTQDIAEPGSYLACDIAGEPVVVTRGRDGEVRAFSNVCRHRGSILTEGKGQTSVIRCPYHAWTYSLEGKLLGQPEFDGVEDWDRSTVCLPQFQATVWGPFVFVNLDHDATPLLD